jgi:hypothetical protein
MGDGKIRYAVDEKGAITELLKNLCYCIERLTGSRRAGD